MHLGNELEFYHPSAENVVRQTAHVIDGPRSARIDLTGRRVGSCSTTFTDNVQAKAQKAKITKLPAVQKPDDVKARTLRQVNGSVHTSQQSLLYS